MPKKYAISAKYIKEYIYIFFKIMKTRAFYRLNTPYLHLLKVNYDKDKVRKK